jgi:hypothetical protein
MRKEERHSSSSVSNFVSFIKSRRQIGESYSTQLGNE